jgi:hypothetical protein
MNPPLTVNALISEAAIFSEMESSHDEPALFGITDGKAVGTYLERKFVAHLMDKYSFAAGNPASGIDIPSINVDIKVTSIKQPQSSCPFQSARQKVYGLGYHLIIFIYEKTDDYVTGTAKLKMCHTIYVAQERTGDYQITTSLRKILANNGNIDDLIAFMSDKNLPLDEIGMKSLAEEILQHTPEEGYLTISNALQWRLQYQRVINKADVVSGIVRIR